jgi:hypothetical protein
MRDVRVEISEVGALEQRREFALPDGSTALTGKTLRDWLDQLGGPRGRIDSPAGEVEVDLTPWLDRDPDATVLRLTVRFVDPSKIGKRYSGRPPWPPSEAG